MQGYRAEAADLAKRSLLRQDTRSEAAVVSRPGRTGDMKAVSRFEYNLLRILHFFLKRLPLEQVRGILVNKFDREQPRCLSRAAVELVQDALAKGCVELLARA